MFDLSMRHWWPYGFPNNAVGLLAKIPGAVLCPMGERAQTFRLACSGRRNDYTSYDFGPNFKSQSSQHIAYSINVCSSFNRSGKVNNACVAWNYLVSWGRKYSTWLHSSSIWDGGPRVRIQLPVIGLSNFSELESRPDTRGRRVSVLSLVKRFIINIRRGITQCVPQQRD